MIHLGACSRWWYALTHQEDHWRQRFLEHVVLARSDAKSNHHSPEETEKQSSGKKGKVIKEITLYDGSWFSTAIRWMRGDTPPPTMLNTSLFQATSYRRFDGAPGECWPLYIPGKSIHIHTQRTTYTRSQRYDHGIYLLNGHYVIRL
jgi:hypothetical protein